MTLPEVSNHFFLVNKSLKNPAKNVEAYNSSSSISSDHRNKEIRLEKWYDYFSILLGKVPMLDNKYTDNDLLTAFCIRDEFTFDKFRHAKGKLKEDEATGLDNIPTDVQKTCNLD